MRFKLLFVFLCWTLYTQAQMSDTSMLIGKIEYKTIKEFSWFEKQYAEYIPKQSTIDSLKIHAPKLKIMAVLGTWCDDSREHIPALFKVTEQVGFAHSQIELIGVDRKKHCPIPDISSLNIEYVPTLFVFLNGELKGKIVETPANTIEEDILKLLTK